jgi:hypothetical protein
MQQNKNDMFEYMRAGGSELPDMVEALKKRGWRNYNHHDNWIHPNVIGEFDTHRAYEYKGMINVPASEAVRVLSKALIEDSEYWEAWKANIAMAIYDQYTDEVPEFLEKVSHYDIHKIANKGADRFLKLLTAEKLTEQRPVIKVGYCAATGNKVLKQYDPGNNDTEEKDWLCLHNDTVEEDLIEVEKFLQKTTEDGKS